MYLFLERGEVRKNRERNSNVWLPLRWPPLGTRPVTQACALTGYWTGNPLVHSPRTIHWATPARASSSFLLILLNFLHTWSSFLQNFVFSFLVFIHFISYSCLTALTRTSRTSHVISERRGKKGHPCLVPDSVRKLLVLAECEVSCRFFVDVRHQGEGVPIYF